MTNAFDEMIEVARRVGITVRHVKLGGSGGGLACVRGVRQLFVDVDAEPADQLEQTARALAAIPELQAVFIRPDVRELIESLSARRHEPA